ncbi:DUF6582 domain-containing protein [Streptomyces roseifaciens]
MTTRIGTITGIALVPGVSRNGRLYTAEAIGRAVQRAQARIEEGTRPLAMLTHHAADDDSTHIVGRLTSIRQAEDGTAHYTADLAGTDHGRAIAALVDGTGGPPFLSGVSIRGAWVGPVRRQPGPDGAPVETADDLEIDGLDFTRKPGVPGARVDTYTPEAAQAPAESAPGRVLITESVQEALVHTTVTEADAPAPPTPGAGGPFADPGYQADKKKRYDISTKARAKAAWSYINQADNARLYTAAQLKRIKGRITKALRGFGVTVATQEGWLIDPIGQVSEAVAECLGFSEDPGHGGSMSISLTNGPTTVTVTSYCVDPHDLDAVGRAAMAGACQAIAALDPDLDADIDVLGARAEDIDGDLEGVDDDAMESALTTASVPEMPAAESTQEKETAMAESTTSPAAETPGTTDSGIDALGAKIDKLTDALAGFVTAMTPPAAAQESAPAEPEAEAVTVDAEMTETEDQRIARLVAEGIKAALPHAVQEHVEATGGPARKGLVAPVTETSSGSAAAGFPEGAPAKPLHEWTQDEWRQYAQPLAVAAVLGNRGTEQPQ